MAVALESNEYEIKWTPCSDLPNKLYEASVAVSLDGSTVYVSAGSAPNDNIKKNVYSYNTNADNWTVLPQPGHCCGVLQILGDRLTIFGGDDPITHKPFNKVTTYNSDTKSWYSFYPNMLNARLLPGIVTYSNHVFAMGGASHLDTIHDSIEVMEYFYHLQWVQISLQLPFPMWGIKPTIYADNVIIVGYGTATGQNIRCFQISAKTVMSCLNEPLCTGEVSTQWMEFSSPPYWNTTALPHSDLIVIIGGNIDGIVTSDVTLYEKSKNLWRTVGSLTSPRDCVGIALINNCTIIVIGGTNSGVTVEEAKASSLTTVEIGNIVPNSSNI